MAANVQSMLAIVLTGIFLTLGGCAPQEADLTLTFEPDDTDTYRVMYQIEKQVQFNQPSLNKSDTQRTVERVETVFDQTVNAVDAEGTAVADITIKELKYYTKNVDRVTFDFDSSRPEDGQKPLAALIGKSYTIRITPQGQVSLVDASGIRGVVKQGIDAKVGENFLKEENIVKRHEVSALPPETMKTLGKGESYTREAATPPGYLDPKKFEKVYTFKDIITENETRLAQVEMTGSPAGAVVGEQPNSFAFLTGVFDAKESYTGTMLMNLDIGDLMSSREVLEAQYLAVDTTMQENPDIEPDTVVMKYTYTSETEEVD